MMSRFCLLLTACLSLFSVMAQAADTPAQILANLNLADENPSPTIGYLTIDDRRSGIDQSTWVYVNAALRSLREQKPAFIILKLDTPGGEVFAAQEISRALHEMDEQYGIPVVAFIDDWAISAGAMLAYSCRYIAVVKGASMGAAEPILLTGGAPESAPEKINSALRADFGNRARLFDRNPDIAEAMVDKDIILVWRKGKVVRLDDESQIQRKGSNADEVITSKGKLLTLTTDDLLKYGVADLQIPSGRIEPKTAAELSKGNWSTSKEPLFSHRTFEGVPSGQVVAYNLSWQEMFLSILVKPAVASILFLGMMVGFYVELNSPGFGLPGSVGLVCLVLIVISSMSLEAVGWLELILIVVGAALIAIDMVLIPTFGLLGIAGVVFLVAGIFGLLLPGLGQIDYDFDTQTLNAAGEFVAERLAWLCVGLIGGIVVIILLARYVLPRSTLLARLVLEGEETREQGYVAGPAREALPTTGTIGVAASPLRPAGKVMIGKELVDAVSDGQFIEKGQQVKIVSVKGSRVVVIEFYGGSSS